MDCQLFVVLAQYIEDIRFRKSAFFSQRVAYVRLKLGQNQGLWSQNGDTMSLGLGGVLQLLKEVAFRVFYHSSTPFVCGSFARHSSVFSGLFQVS